MAREGYKLTEIGEIPEEWDVSTNSLERLAIRKLL